MTNDEILRFMSNKNSKNNAVQINFRSRSAIKGLFIKTSDYDELRRKNLWRIVSEANMESYLATGNESLARIFNGVDFTRMELLT